MTNTDLFRKLLNEVAALNKKIDELVVNNKVGEAGTVPTAATEGNFEVVEYEGEYYALVTGVALEGDLVRFNFIADTPRNLVKNGDRLYKVYANTSYLYLNELNVYGQVVHLRDTIRTHTYNVYNKYSRTEDNVKVYRKIKTVNKVTTSTNLVPNQEKKFPTIRETLIKQAVIDCLDWEREAIADGKYIQFIRNHDGSTTVALVRKVSTGKVVMRGKAKVTEGDVRNDYIGNVIALGKALGKDISMYLDVPNPTVLAKGQLIKRKYQQGEPVEVCYIRKNGAVFTTDGTHYSHTITSLDIVDDSSADYSSTTVGLRKGE